MGVVFVSEVDASAFGTRVGPVLEGSGLENLAGF